MLSVFFSNTNKFFSKGSQDQYTLSFGKFIIFCLLLCTWSQFATATAKSHFSRFDSVRPHPWDSTGKNTGVGFHFLLQCIKVKSESEVAQSCPTLCDPMDCTLPGSSVHGIFQARVLEWGAIACSGRPV